MKSTTLPGSHFLPMLFAISLLGVSVYALVLETAPFTNGLNSPAQRFAYFEQESSALSLSILGKRIVLNDCLEAIAGPLGRAQPSIRRNTMLSGCNTLAKEIVASAPSFALSWYIAAFSSAELDLFEDFNLQLTASQKTAPNEQWLAQLRVALAEDNLAHLNGEALLSHEKDLKLLVQSRLGVASIAARYVAQQDFKERITSIVETLSNEDQRRFVSYVRSAARSLIQLGGNSQ